MVEKVKIRNNKVVEYQIIGNCGHLEWWSVSRFHDEAKRKRKKRLEKIDYQDLTFGELTIGHKINELVDRVNEIYDMLNK